MLGCYQCCFALITIALAANVSVMCLLQKKKRDTRLHKIKPCCAWFVTICWISALRECKKHNANQTPMSAHYRHTPGLWWSCSAGGGGGGGAGWVRVCVRVCFVRVISTGSLVFTRVIPPSPLPLTAFLNLSPSLSFVSYWSRRWGAETQNKGEIIFIKGA